MNFNAESNKRTVAKEEKAQEEAKVRHEAVLAHCRKNSRPAKRKKKTFKMCLALASEATEMAKIKTVSLSQSDQARHFQMSIT